MPAATYRAYADWNDDGDFGDTYEDITADVLDDRAAVTAQYGRDQARALSPISAGRGSLTLDNEHRRYSPENAGSPLNGQVLPARKVLITGTVGATTYTVLRAVIDDFELRPDHNDQSVDVSLIDALGQLRDVQVSTELHQGMRPGEAIGVILDAVGWPAALRDLDVGATVMPFWWLDGDDAFGAILDLVDSEGPPALVTVDSSGRIVFRSRHHRLQDTASTAVQSTWRSSGGIEPLISSPATYNHGFKEIVNSVRFELPRRQLAGDLAPVWTASGIIGIAAGETVQIIAQGSSPFSGAVTPEAGTDFTPTGTVAVALSRTSGGSTTISLTANGAPATVADLQLRAYPLTTVATEQVLVEDPSSIANFDGRRSLPTGRDPKWPSVGDAKAIGSIILTQRSDRLPTITVTMVSANTTRVTQQLSRNLSDRVHVVEPHTGLDADCFIEQISHTITQGGAEHKTVFGLEKAPSQVANVFVLGTGVLGTNRLGRRATADPSTMFVLGTQGVLGTNILAP